VVDKWHTLTEDSGTVKEHSAVLSTVDSTGANKSLAPVVILSYVYQSVSLPWDVSTLETRCHWMWRSPG